MKWVSACLGSNMRWQNMYRVLSICGVFSWDIPVWTAPFLALLLLGFGIWGIWRNRLKIRKLHSLQPLKASHFVTQSFQSAELGPLRMSPYKEAVLPALWALCESLCPSTPRLLKKAGILELHPLAHSFAVFIFGEWLFLLLLRSYVGSCPLFPAGSSPQWQLLFISHTHKCSTKRKIAALLVGDGESLLERAAPPSLSKGQKALRILSILFQFSRDI